MEDDQQFCLRWNNHQNTLISNFDKLLENGTLVDCTLAAEGQFLKAHKVVLSACSPYFANLLKEQYDKHPIFILKDVKYQELRAMMDYMYRGEVNISQDQLAALLKAAESLQIKGLSDRPQRSTDQHPNINVPGRMQHPHGGGYTLEQTKRPRLGPVIDTPDMREGSSSPTSRKRKKLRRRSIENVMDNHEHSNSSAHSTQPINTSTPSITSGTAAIVATSQQQQQQSQQSLQQSSVSQQQQQQGNIVGTKKTENVSNIKQTAGSSDDVLLAEQDNQMEQEKQIKKDQNKQQRKSGHDKDELLIEPKNEYEEVNEPIEDLTEDPEELMDEEDLDNQAGPSHHGGEGSSQGFPQWPADRSQDEFIMTAQDQGQQRDPQGYSKRTTDHELVEEESIDPKLEQTETSRDFLDRSKQRRKICDIDYDDHDDGDDDNYDDGDDDNDIENFESDGNKNDRLQQKSCDSNKTSSSSSPMPQPLNLQVIKGLVDSIQGLTSTVASSSMLRSGTANTSVGDSCLDKNIPFQSQLSHSQPIKSPIIKQQQQHPVSSLEHVRHGSIDSDRRICTGDTLESSSVSQVTTGSGMLIGAALSPSAGASISLISPSLHSQQQQQQQQPQQHELFKTFSALQFPFDLTTMIKTEDQQRLHPFVGGTSASGPSGSISYATTGTSSGNLPNAGNNEITIMSGARCSPILSGNVSSNIGQNSGISGEPGCSGNTSGSLIPQPGTSMGGGSGWGAFTCKKCGNTYARPHSLNRHLRFECGVEPKFECPICHKKSKHKHNLVLHMRTHNHR
ncbi:longitudinals lacking protein, isoforms A/B/D/L isoform X4 [Condylostylus longicornis]|uniref:longitudinals lacking protein, isoforms A/B/D/L isoform X4 n=1 Tax=Condylostylus longicornis TaxID=2530218 RepID=UPI00244DDDE2|nr:longitudinals lacking protein, isoforms A/B/D/L isoform X4 [Condylostylus longicornis]